MSEISKQESSPSTMMVRKRNGNLEPVDITKITNFLRMCGQGIADVDPTKVAIKTIGGLYDGAKTSELDKLAISTASSLIVEEPGYSKLAASILSEVIRKEVEQQGVQSFSGSIEMGFNNGLIDERLYSFVKANARKLNDAIDPRRDRHFEYFGLQQVYDRYLLKHPTSRARIETPQYFFLRVATALSSTVKNAIELYRLISTHRYMPSTPTLFNAGTRRPQMSSCYLHALPEDSIEGIYDIYKEIALNSKFAGGIGLPFNSIRSESSLIRGTNGESNGIIPWLATLNWSVAAVNQGGKRKGAAAIYVSPWHADFESFIELKNNTGDQARRAYNLNLACWIPDVFMEVVQGNGIWHMFDPFDVPELNNTFGDEFRAAYFAAVDAGKAKKKVKAQDLYGLIVKTLAETGNGWMCFSDACNVKNNQTGMPGNVVSSSNLCTEITEVSRRGKTPEESETAVCNLGSIVLPSYVQVEGRRRANSHDVYVRNGLEMDFAELRKHVQLYVRQLDTVIDYNFYPVESAKRSNHKWRPVGLGMMGLQDVFFRFGIAFDSPEALALSTRISEEIYFAALTASADLAEKHGPFPAFNESRTKDGVLQFDLWNVIPSSHLDWPGLKERIKKVGVRNSLLIAIAPTATIGSITGVYECIEPQVTNLLKRETLSGEFIQINKYLVSDLKKLNLWNEEIRNLIKLNDGSIQSISQIPQSLRDLYKTAWEIPQKVLIDLAAARGAFIDQSQSLNLFMASPNIGKLSSMYMYAWKQGLKTTYYLRSRPATKIAKTTVTHAINAVPQIPEYTVSQSVMCSLENPEACEACQ